MDRIELIKCDITLLNVDAIVNAANNTLLGGGGVDGAIHRSAGKELYEECLILGGCITGQAKITKGYKLSAKYIIHTVGPVWVTGNCGESRLLANCYKNCLHLAVEYQIKTIAFPSISTGAFHFPKRLAATIAIHETNSFLQNCNLIEKVIFVAFDDENFDIYKEKINC
jgi:O-acetyl-ADP-ribose deacetylase (regulator of RNase III)